MRIYRIFLRKTAARFTILQHKLLYENPETCVRLPMRSMARSLNLSNTVAIAVYEALRQQDFDGLLEQGSLRDYQWEETT